MLKIDLRSKLKKKYGVKQECSALSKSDLGQQIELFMLKVNEALFDEAKLGPNN